MSCTLYGFIEVPSEQREREGEAPMVLPLEGATLASLPGAGQARAPIIESEEKKDLGIAAVTGKPPHENLEGLSKEKLVQALLEYQRTLENIMKTQFILPCKFGTMLRDEKEAQEILAQNISFLKTWMEKMKNCCEFDVIAAWDVRKTVQEIAVQDPSIVELKKAVATLPPEEQERAKLSIGIQLSTKLKERAECCAKHILNRLKEKSAATAPHDLMNDSMVFNASFLLDRRQEDSFGEILEEIDKYFEGKLHFKCVGPLPPHSFATIQVKRFDPEQIMKAGQTLGLNGEADLKRIKQAYKLKAQHCHPDTHPGLDKKEFEALNQAYALLMDYYKGGCKPVSVEVFKCRSVEV